MCRPPPPKKYIFPTFSSPRLTTKGSIHSNCAAKVVFLCISNDPEVNGTVCKQLTELLRMWTVTSWISFCFIRMSFLGDVHCCWRKYFTFLMVTSCFTSSLFIFATTLVPKPQLKPLNVPFGKWTETLHTFQVVSSCFHTQKKINNCFLGVIIVCSQIIITESKQDKCERVVCLSLWNVCFAGCDTPTCTTASRTLCPCPGAHSCFLLLFFFFSQEMNWNGIVAQWEAAVLFVSSPTLFENLKLTSSCSLSLSLCLSAVGSLSALRCLSTPPPPLLPLVFLFFVSVPTSIRSSLHPVQPVPELPDGCALAAPWMGISVHVCDTWLGPADFYYSAKPRWLFFGCFHSSIHTQPLKKKKKETF